MINFLDMLKFETEQEFQIWLGYQLARKGFEVYTDKKICDLPTFKGAKDKSDLLIFRNMENDNPIGNVKISNPFFIETKLGDAFNQIPKSIIQLRKYHNKYYDAGDYHHFKVDTFLLTTPSAIKYGHIYRWSMYENLPGGWDGIHWASLHWLGTLSRTDQYCGFLVYKHNQFMMQFDVGDDVHRYLKDGQVIQHLR